MHTFLFSFRTKNWPKLQQSYLIDDDYESAKTKAYEQTYRYGSDFNSF